MDASIRWNCACRFRPSEGPESEPEPSFDCPEHTFIGARIDRQEGQGVDLLAIFWLPSHTGVCTLPNGIPWPMKITSHIFEAYLKCPTKSWLLSREEPHTGNTYADWVKRQSETYRSSASKLFLGRIAANEPIDSQIRLVNSKEVRWRFARDASAQFALGSKWPGANLPCDLEAQLHLVQRVPSNTGATTDDLMPIRFVFRNKLNIYDRLLVALDTIAISELTGRMIDRGKIVHGENYITSSVDTSSLASEVRKLVGKLTTNLGGQSPPDLVLNRHCPECEFRDRCRCRHARLTILACFRG